MHIAMTSRVFLFCVALATVGAIACSSSADQPGSGGRGGPGGGMLAVPVDTKTLSAVPVERASDYVATIKSRRSATIQPQVEGFITRIVAHSGDRVKAGQPLLEIDPRQQEATVTTQESDRQARESAVAYTKAELARGQELFKEGIIAKAELDARQNAYDQALSALTAMKARVAEEKVNLQYYTVRAPTDGVVGDIPVRVGDRVTKTSVLTTVESNQGLEAYVQVPIERASDLREGLSVHILGDDGQTIETSRIAFVSDLAEANAQTVLAKVPLTNPGGVLRPAQFVRARVVWGMQQALKIPVTSVLRINGQSFGFVAEAQGQAAVARQRKLAVGDIVGNDYIVLGGLNPGDRVITSGVQKLRDGAPVRFQS